MITSGYLNGPLGSPSAQPVQFDPTQAGAGISVNVVLGQAHWPANISTSVSDASRDFGVGFGVPYRCDAGHCIRVSKAEASVLIALGAATGA